MKSTCPTLTQREHAQRKLYFTGARFGHCRIALGIGLGPPGLLDTNMLVLVMRKSRVGGFY